MMQKIVYYYEKLVMRISIAANRFGKLPAGLQCSWVLVFLLIVIVCNLQFIAKSGDAIHKWFLIRVFLENGTFLPLQPDHHLLRWGLIWPVIAFCKLLGYSIYLFYLYPILCYCAGGVVLFLLARQILSVTMASITVLLYAFYPVIIHEGTQFLPMVPATVWILLTLLVTLRFIDGKQRKSWLMAVAGICLTIAYGCKETSFFWAPGIFLFLAFAPTEKYCFKWKKIHLTPGMLLFFFTCIAGIGLETLVLNEIYDCRLGRYELLCHTHLIVENQSEYPSVLEYLFSFLRQFRWDGKYYSFIPQNLSIMLGCIAAFVLIYRGDVRRRFLAVAFLGAYLCHCYIIFNIHPISYPERVIHRYLIAVISVGILLFCAALPTLADWCRNGRKWRWALLLTAISLWILTSAIYTVNSRLNDGNLFQLERMRQVVPEALKNGDAVGVITERKKVELDATGRVLPDKWGLLHLRCWGEVPMFFDILKNRCEFTPYDSKRVIVWLTLPGNGKKEIVLDQFSIIARKAMPDK